VHHVDEQRTTCDSCIACRFKKEHDGSKVDYVGIIEEILEVDFKSFKTLLLKVQWFCKNHYELFLFLCLQPERHLGLFPQVLLLQNPENVELQLLSVVHSAQSENQTY
jgi:hypothetical protein